MDTIHKDYKEIFLGNLERNVVKELRLEVELQSEDELGNEVKDQTVRVRVVKSLIR
ncbi:hypothetical protein BDCR2A_01509 [Borrelia duttonii CR2A]|uniref:Uncharacterized protein n=1 Tax=Borrelia duttonii CR2A TaxID=1432657 RepID=W6TWX4_9SPIR|nr:hypothetical protein [Borrelia duttonii]ETZ17566.1 hypothetical protein BDCR2A_01509 [Borrelia duttonii CR2A]